MAKYKIVGLFSCESLIDGVVSDEEALKILKNRVNAALSAYLNAAFITISKCERIKEEDNGNKG